MLAAPPTGRYTLAARAGTASFDPFAANNADAVELGVVSVGVDDAPEAGLPREVTLRPVRPNPARGPVEVRYALPHRADVDVQVFDVLGREVARLRAATDEPGWHTAGWDGPLSSGVYVLRLRARTGTGTGTVTRTQRFIVLR